MRVFAAALLSICVAVSASWGDEPYSGPQVGERLVPFTVQGTFGEVAGKAFDVVTMADGKPVLIIFVHEVTRPSLGLTRLVMSYAASRAKDGLVSGVVFLSADPTETENWMKRASHALPQHVALGISPDGQEGPGAYGLNRNVSLTVLVGNQNKVTANFAIVQPSIQADAPKIAKEIVQVLGGGKVPALEEMENRGDDSNPAARMNDSTLDALLRSLIQKTATAEQVQKAITDIEAYAADTPAAQQRIGETARRIIAAGKLENYGTPAAQTQLKAWAEKYKSPDTRSQQSPRAKKGHANP
ncbi:MAG: hypothetical protein H6822_10845 [Planctomycetaceae bacterium]|nr:hypothetical protein [Planctomycetales bacterium]MCB9922671.1 hypothetical protein [Planctomycetaceae bacterium]